LDATTLSPRVHQPLFVLGAPRSGTTLLQRLLNSYPDVVIWGEHAGFLEGLARAFFQGWDAQQLFEGERVRPGSDPARTWQGWMNGFDREAWKRAFRGLVEALWLSPAAEGVRVWGFKEIRYLQGPGDRSLDLLRLLYPDAMYAFIVRDPFNALASLRKYPGGWAARGGLRELCDAWRSRYEGYRTLHASGAVRSFWIVFEELIAQRGDVLRLLDALGKGFGPAQEGVLRSSEGRGSSFDNQAFNDRWRALPGWSRRVIHASLADLARELGYEPPPMAPTDRLLGRLQLLRLALHDVWSGPIRQTVRLVRGLGRCEHARAGG
jgi:hypothetical protein